MMSIERTTEKFNVYSESQWVYPDDELKELDEKLLTLDVARGGNVLCQILTDITVEEKTPFTFSVKGANGITIIPYQLVSVRIKRNSAPDGKPNANKTDDYEAVKDFVTRQAPFDVYDITAPMDKCFVRGGRLGFAFRFIANRDISAGVQKIVITVETQGKIVEVPITLNVHKATIPALQDSKLIVINWAIASRIAGEAKAKKYSKEYYEMYEKLLAHLVDIRNTQLFLTEWWRSNPDDECVRDENGKIIDFDLSNLEKSLQIAEKAGMPILSGWFVARFLVWNQPEIYLLWDWDNKHLATDVEAYRQLKLYFKRVKEMVERNHWQKKYVQCLFDEPQFANAENYRILVGMIRSIYPELVIHDPVEVDNIPGSADIWCVKNAIYEKYKESFQKQQAEGQRMTWYACGAPAGRMMNRTIDLPLIVSRLCFWICHRYNFEGFLHFGYHLYSEFENGLTDTREPGGLGIVYNVDGDYWDTVRAHAQRAGAEDWELVSIIKEKAPALADKLVERACRTLEDYETDWKAFDALRLEVLNEADKCF